MRVAIIALVLFALAAAGGTAFLVKRLLEARPAPQAVAEVEKPAAKTMVLVAARDLPAGSTVGSGSLRWQPWPEGTAAKGFVVASEKDKKLEQQFVDTVVRRGITEGTPITQAMVFKRGEPGFLAGALDPGMRAISIKVTPESGAAGFILPGDRVDVILTYTGKIDKEYRLQKVGNEQYDLGPGFTLSKTVARDVRVLAVDQKVDEFEQKAQIAKTVTLEVTAKQAEMVSLAVNLGPLSLALRSVSLEPALADDRSFTTDVEVSPAVFLPFLAAHQLRAIADMKGDLLPEALAPAAPKEAPKQPAPAAAPPPPAPPGESAKVKVYRGSQPSVQEFSGQ
jgi:pilus assembly protein CpaB